MIPIDLSQEKQHEPVKGYKVKFMHTDNMTFAFWDIKKGYSVPRHSHPNEQVVKVLEGRLELTLEDKTFTLEPGLVLVIPPGKEHSALSLSDCKVIDTFYPVREDYLNL